MKKKEKTVFPYVIKKGDAFKSRAIIWSLILFVILPLTPWLLKIMPFVLYWCYAMMFLGLVLIIAGLIKTCGKKNTSLLEIDSTGVRMRMNDSFLCYSWDKIESLSLRYVSLSRGNKGHVFFVKPLGKDEISFVIGPYIAFLYPTINRIKKLTSQYTENHANFVYSWRQLLGFSSTSKKRKA